MLERNWRSLIETQKAVLQSVPAEDWAGAFKVLEALSRGASSVDLVENGSEALHALTANVAARKLRAPEPGAPARRRSKAARVFKRDAIPFVRALGKVPVAYATTVWQAGFPPDPDTSRMYGWRRDEHPNKPKGQAFALLDGGQLYKLRLPLAGADALLPKDPQEIWDTLGAQRGISS